MATQTTAVEWSNVRWATDRFSDGTWRAYAWQSAPEGTPPIFAEVNGETELAALDGLRVALLARIKRPTDRTLTNDRGDRISVGGGYAE
jgi:hypothetical protein